MYNGRIFQKDRTRLSFLPSVYHQINYFKKMIRRSTIQLLRFHFSFFLMPVYWFALSQVVNPDIKRALLIFIILHILIYPSSNGFNSYMDRDEGSIGGLKSPLP